MRCDAYKLPYNLFCSVEYAYKVLYRLYFFIVKCQKLRTRIKRMELIQIGSYVNIIISTSKVSQDGRRLLFRIGEGSQTDMVEFICLNLCLFMKLPFMRL